MAIDRTTLETYAKMAQTRDDTQPNKELWLPEAQRFISMLPGRRVLEVGCGTGRDAKYFFHLSYTGTDACEELLTIAREKNPGAHFEFGDVYSLPFVNASFDGAWAAAVYLHVPSRNIITTLRELHRVIVPGGVAWLSMHAGAVEGFADSNHGKRYFAQYQHDEFGHILESSGFKIEDIQYVDAHARNAPTKQQMYLSCFVRA